MKKPFNPSPLQLKTMKENGVKRGLMVKKQGFFSSELQSKRRIAQLKSEESLADELRKNGYEVFSPTVVCDRIAVKNGKVYFIEFKKEGQKLREGQQIIHDLVPRMYKIIYD